MAEYARAQTMLVPTPVTEDLAQRAEVRFEQERWLLRLPHFQRVAAYKRLLAVLRELKPEKRVLILVDFGQGLEYEDYLPASAAVRVVERQARDYAAQKAAEYRDKAQTSLEDHDPEAAEREIFKAFELFSLDEEESARCGLLQEAKIKPAVERRARAKALLLEAQKNGRSTRGLAAPR